MKDKSPAISDLIDMLKSDNKTSNDEAERALKSIGKDAIPYKQVFCGVKK